MNYEAEIGALRAKTQAIETVVIGVLARISRLDPTLATAIHAGLDDAASRIVARTGNSDAGRERAVDALDVVDTLRRSMVPAGQPSPRGPRRHAGRLRRSSRASPSSR